MCMCHLYRAAVRLYDLRMIRQPGSTPGASVVPWTACFAPSALARAPFGSALPRAPWALRNQCSVSGLCFDHTGRRLLATYTNSEIYIFE
jgi:hypothetical protein